MTSGHKWRRLERATPKPANEALIQGLMKSHRYTREEAVALIAKSDNDEIWLNDLYQVAVHRHPDEGFVHLNIRRRDGYPGRDWRHFQQIKNELVGDECEAVELYPAESRLVDQGNKYYLWVVLDPAYRFPFGWTTRDVDYAQHPGAKGLRQRPPMQFKEEKP